MEKIDCRGLICPMPVIKTKKYFDSKDVNEALVVVDNEVAKNNILRLAKGLKLNNKFTEENGIYNISLSRGEISENVEVDEEAGKELAILVSSNKLGNGDERLGETLMKVYINTLAESEVLPKNIMLINSGVFLACEGSDVIDSLNSMISKGVEIFSCGVCIDFYNLKEKVKAGEIGNMYQIIDIMNRSDNTIKL